MTKFFYNDIENRFDISVDSFNIPIANIFSVKTFVLNHDVIIIMMVFKKPTFLLI